MANEPPWIQTMTGNLVVLILDPGIAISGTYIFSKRQSSWPSIPLGPFIKDVSSMGEGGGYKKCPKRRCSLVDLRRQGEGVHPENLKFAEMSFMNGPFCNEIELRALYFWFTTDINHCLVIVVNLSFKRQKKLDIRQISRVEFKIINSQLHFRSFHWMDWWINTKYSTPNVCQFFLLSSQFEKKQTDWTLLFSKTKNFAWHSVFSICF